MASEIKIDKGVPLPDVNYSVPRSNRYPWEKLNVRDSFFMPSSAIPNQVALYRAASQAGQRLDRRFTCRTVKGGVRVWRTA